MAVLYCVLCGFGFGVEVRVVFSNLSRTNSCFLLLCVRVGVVHAVGWRGRRQVTYSPPLMHLNCYRGQQTNTYRLRQTVLLCCYRWFHRIFRKQPSPHLRVTREIPGVATSPIDLWPPSQISAFSWKQFTVVTLK